MRIKTNELMKAALEVILNNDELVALNGDLNNPPGYRGTACSGLRQIRKLRQEYGLIDYVLEGHHRRFRMPEVLPLTNFCPISDIPEYAATVFPNSYVYYVYLYRHLPEIMAARRRMMRENLKKARERKRKVTMHPGLYPRLYPTPDQRAVSLPVDPNGQMRMI